MQNFLEDAAVNNGFKRIYRRRLQAMAGRAKRRCVCLFGWRVSANRRNARTATMSGMDKARSFIVAALDTATFGFSDEMAAGLTAAGKDSMVHTNRHYSKTGPQDQLKQKRMATGGQVAGGLIPAAAAPKAIKGVYNMPLQRTIANNGRQRWTWCCIGVYMDLEAAKKAEEKDLRMSHLLPLGELVAGLLVLLFLRVSGV